ncbi:MAG: hypothetical protein RIC55_03060 [Pirellulaceae bacterium]
MQEFPFSADEWDAVTASGNRLVNATLADDSVLRDVLLREFFELLAQLRARHGEHPVLLETEADYLDDPLERKHRYEAALRLARENHLPTFTICIFFAQLLMDEFDDVHRAAEILASCRDEIERDADPYYRGEWTQLVGRTAREIAGEREPRK